MRGYVYVLSNDSMPGLLKIGRSKHGGLSRAKQMFDGDTGVPTPFRLEFECFFDDVEDAEKEVHEWLEHDRISASREFFRVEVDEAIMAVMGVRACRIGAEIEYCDSNIRVCNIKAHNNCEYFDQVMPPEWREIMEDITSEEARPAFERVKARRIKRIAEFNAANKVVRIN